jgi:hypothetical protein
MLFMVGTDDPPTKTASVAGKECKMATKTEVLAEIAAYSAANGRPCPVAHLASKFGDGVADTVKDLKASGAVYGKRGRTGGLVANEAPSTDAGVQLDEAAAGIDNGNDLAAEFAALAAKLAEQDTATAANG